MNALFFKLLDVKDKAGSLLDEVRRFRIGESSERRFSAESKDFEGLPGKAFSYWLSREARVLFDSLPRLGSNERVLKQGLATADDGRFIRCWWEVSNRDSMEFPGKWIPFIKGVENNIAYSETRLFVNWGGSGAEIKNNLNKSGIPRSNVWMLKETEIRFFFRPGLAWPSRPLKRGYFSIVPKGCLFSHTSTMLFAPVEQLWSLCGVVNSAPYSYLLHSLMPRGGGDTGQTLQYEVGYVSSIPIPGGQPSVSLTAAAILAWKIGYSRASINETSHAFLLPVSLRSRLGKYDALEIESELAQIQQEFDATSFGLYGFTDFDREAALAQISEDAYGSVEPSEEEEDDIEFATSALQGLLPWAVGTAFGRFDWRFATSERDAPTEPEPFDPLPAKSPGMLPDGAASFHAHAGILVDDPGHRHDLVRLVEDVLARVEMPAQDGLRRWLQKDFFAFHLQSYSKSRRKAPIYWPLPTASGSYTLWLYYPSLTRQTLYTAINDFVEPKLAQVAGDVAALRSKGAARSRDEEKRFEASEALELELIELRDQLLKIAPGWHPNHDDGVQITAAPLWPLFRHKPWQKILKETWAKLEKGDYDWAHLAMSYWPDRVREKCKTDKSLAIAHGLEALYIEPPPKATAKRGRKAKEA